MMLSRVAPSALRTPISRVRSVTDTSMMFMIPMPPTSETHRRDAGEQRGEDLGGLLLGRQHVLLVPDGEVVLAAGPDLVLPPQDPLEVHHALLDRHAVRTWTEIDRSRLRAEHPVARGLRAESGSARPGLPKPPAAPFSLRIADHLERDAPDRDGLIDHARPGLAPSMPGTAGAEHGVALAGLVVARGEHPAVRHGVVPDLDVVRRGAHDVDVDVLVAVLHLQRR